MRGYSGTIGGLQQKGCRHRNHLSSGLVVLGYLDNRAHELVLVHRHVVCFHLGRVLPPVEMLLADARRVVRQMNVAVL